MAMQPTNKAPRLYCLLAKRVVPSPSVHKQTNPPEFRVGDNADWLVRSIRLFPAQYPERRWLSMNTVHRRAAIVDCRKHRLHVGRKSEGRLGQLIEMREFLRCERYFQGLHVVLELRDSACANDCGCDSR